MTVIGRSLERPGAALRGSATALVLIAALVNSGCALIGGGTKPLDTYDLSAAQPDAAAIRATRRQILITEPAALKAYDGENIVVAPEASSITYLEGAQWGDRLPKVVQARLAESFQRSGRILGVGLPGDGLAVDFQVISTIRAFEIRVDGPERAYVELSVRLLDDRRGVVRRQEVFDATVPVSGSGNDAYVRALNAAFERVSADIVDWTLRSM